MQRSRLCLHRRFVHLLLAGASLCFASARAAQPAPRLLLLDAALAGADVLAVGERSTVLRSTDSGQSWDSIAAPATATLTGVAFADERRGWAVGHDALILHTADGGRTWEKQWQGDDLEASFLDVCAIGPDHVIAVGAYGLYLVTRDGGRSWAAQKILTDDMHLNRISRGPTGTLYLAGERGTLLRSTDTGETWIPIDSPYDGSFYGIVPLSATTLVAHGLRGRIYRSTDNGDSWERVAVEQPMLLATALKTAAGPIVFAGQARALFVSRDDGLSVSPWPLDFTAAIAELLQAPDGAILAFGEAGVARLPAP